MGTTEKNFRKSVKRLSSAFALGINAPNLRRMQEPHRSSTLPPKAGSSSHSRGPSPSGHKLSTSLQIPGSQQLLSPTDISPASAPAEISVNRRKPHSGPPSPSSAKYPSDVGLTPAQDGSSIRRKWLPRSRNTSEDRKNLHMPSAWIITREGYEEYDLTHLKNSEKVPPVVAASVCFYL
jgi:hypothetical protein